MTLLFIKITGGTATVVLEISDDDSLYIPVATVTASASVQFAIPSSVLAVNVSAISGATVTVTYRTVVLQNMPTQTLVIYDSVNGVSSPIELQNVTTISGDESQGRKKLAQVQAAATATTIYTVPVGTQTEIHHIRVTNPTATARTIKLWHDGSSDSNVILPAVTIEIGGWGEFDGVIYMEAGDTLVAQASAATALTVTVYGIEHT